MNRQPLICFGHRGAKGYEPENTLKSIEKAIALGAHWIEIDVYAVHGRVLVIHDNTVDRTTDGSGSIYKLPIEQLRELDAGDGQKIPFLEEVLETVRDRVPLNIEIKGKGAAQAVSEVLSRWFNSGGRPADTLVSSFYGREIWKLRELLPEVSTGLNVDRLVTFNLWRAVTLGCRSFHLDISVAKPKIIRKAKKAGLKVYVFTVNEPEEIERMKAWSVDGVFCDFPDRVLVSPPRLAE